jgi:hypothetical protein
MLNPVAKQSVLCSKWCNCGGWLAMKLKTSIKLLNPLQLQLSNPKESL